MAGDFLSQVASMRANARPQYQGGGGRQVMLGNIGGKVTTPGRGVDWSGVANGLKGMVDAFEQDKEEEVKRAVQGHQLSQALDPEQKKWITQQPQVQKMRQAQARLDGARELFVDAGEYYNDPRLKGFLEYVDKIPSLEEQTAKSEYMKRKKGEVPLSEKASELGVEAAEAQIKGMNLENRLNALKADLEEQYGPEKAKLAVDEMIKNLSLTDEQIGLTKAQADEARARAGYLRKQTQAFTSDMDKDLTTLGIKNEQENKQTLIKNWQEDITKMRESYADGKKQIDPASYAGEALSSTRALVYGMGTKEVLVTDPKTGQQGLADINQALLSPTARYAVTQALNDGYTAFMHIVQNSPKLTEDQVIQLGDLYDLMEAIWDEMLSNTQFPEVQALSEVRGAQRNLGAMMDKMKYMQYLVKYQWGQAPSDPQALESWNQERSTLEAMYSKYVPQVEKDGWLKRILGWTGSGIGAAKDWVY